MQQHKFITCIEINPPRSSDVNKVIAGCKLIKEGGVDAVNIPDGPRASARMSSLALASIIESQVKMETILHYTCRDRNILGMQSDLLGAHALGLRNILIVTGDPPKLGDYPTATAVFNVDSIGLVRIANRLNHSIDLASNPIAKGTTFYLGVGANPGAINFEEEMERLTQKIDAGAEYILTQPLFESSLFNKFMNRMANKNTPILAGILISFSRQSNRPAIIKCKTRNNSSSKTNTILFPIRSKSIIFLPLIDSIGGSKVRSKNGLAIRTFCTGCP